MISTANPRSRNPAITSSTARVSAGPRAAVGSSMTMTFDPHAAAREMAIACRCPPESCAVGASMGGIVRLRRESIASASLAMRRLSRMRNAFGPRNSSRPRKMLAQTGMFPASARSW